MGKQARLRAARAELARKAESNAQLLMSLWPKIAEPIIYQEFSPDCCLNATRVLIDVFAAFHIEVEPIATSVLVVNPKMYSFMRMSGGWPESNAQMDAWVEQGAWVIGVDGRGIPGRESEGWPWHLVGLVHNKYLIDCSAKQMNRPERDIDIGNTVVLKVAEDWRHGNSELVVRKDGETVKGGIAYTAKPEIQDFVAIDGFQRSPWNLDIARRITQLLTVEIRRLAG